MKKFIGYINREKFDDVKLFSEKLKELDWSKQHHVTSEYFNEEKYNENDDAQHCTCQKQQDENTQCCSCKKQCNETENDIRTKIKDESYIITDNDIRNMSDHDVLILGKQYSNQEHILKCAIDEDTCIIKECNDEIDAIQRHIDNVIKKRTEAEHDLNDNQLKLDSLKRTGRLKLADEYYRCYKDYLNTFFDYPFYFNF